MSIEHNTDRTVTKKAYAAPKLSVYGDVGEITQGPGRGWIDAIFGIGDGDGGWRPPYNHRPNRGS